MKKYQWQTRINTSHESLGFHYPANMKTDVKRLGQRPETSTSGPHSQLTQQSSREIWEALVERALALPHVIRGTSAVSPITSVGLFFDDLTEIKVPSTSLSPNAPLEPVHIHGPHDTSTHLCLPTARAIEVCELGWGEPHQFESYGTEIMVYGPRDENELEIVLGFVAESFEYARANN